MNGLAPEALDRVRQFIASRGWSLAREGERFNDFAPPAELQLPEQFRLTLPRSAESPDVGRYLDRLVDTLGEIYGLSGPQIQPVLANASTVLSVSIEDDTTRRGVVGFTKFEAMMDRLRRMILHTAAFVAEGDPVIEYMPPEAQTYLTRCNFLQTQFGSFVANVELPSGDIAPERPLLDTKPLDAATVNSKIADVIGYVVGPVMRGDVNVFSDEHVRDNLDLINVNVLDDVRSMFHEAGTETSLAFSFVGVDETRRILAGPLSRDKTYALSEFVKFAKKRVTETVPLNVDGKVVELRSRNPQRNRNYIVVLAFVEGHSQFVALTLNNEMYQTAIQAHRTSRAVHIVGSARRMKTQLKVVQLNDFYVVA